MRGGGWNEVGNVSGRSVASQIARIAIPILLVLLLVAVLWWLYSANGADRPYLAASSTTTAVDQPVDETSTTSEGAGNPAASPQATIIDLNEDVPESVQSTFERFDVVQISIGEDCEKLLAALSASQRREGLRGNEESLEYIDGMIFAFDEEREVGFTMAGVTDALDIGFYAADGTLVDRLEMEPCDDTTEQCPIYRSDTRFQYAIEAAAGQLSDGDIAACGGDPIDTVVVSQ
ncbi:MAG: DUF192 domain-containing protein [Acidimicrobiia bacterium]|nr:DUF192 domain-containing protein [Acidimicrobiia bacterium]